MYWSQNLDNITQYRFAAIDVVMQILRPNATFELYGDRIARWDDPRPQPTREEILEMLEAIKKFEDQKIMYITQDGTDEMIQVPCQDFSELETATNK
jgi:hypothetical protein